MQCGRTQKDGDDMQIGFAPASSKEGLKALWRTVFGDPEAYIDLFLEHRFRPEQTLVPQPRFQPAVHGPPYRQLKRIPGEDAAKRGVAEGNHGFGNIVVQ